MNVPFLKKYQPQFYKEFIIDNLPSYKISPKNRCIYCKVDMGECNPRQLCYKTYCPNQELEID